MYDEKINIKLSDKRYEEIKQSVIQMLINYNVSSFPISGFEIANKMGIEIIPYSKYSGKTYDLFLLRSEDGFCMHNNKNKKWYIYYNDKQCSGRVTYTVMHEIGHIVLDHSEDSELAEKEVNFFAKYALVPPPLIHELGLNNINSIKKIFKVSDEFSCYAFKYYKKWLTATYGIYSDYELQLVELFTKDIKYFTRVS